MKRIVNSLLYPIRRNPLFYTALLLLFGMSVVFVEYAGCSRVRALLEMFFDAYLLCLLVSMVPGQMRRCFKQVLYAFFYIVGLADMLSFCITGMPLMPNVLQTWFQTNVGEATEALHSYLSWSLLATPVVLFLVFPLLLWYMGKRRFAISRKAAGCLFCLFCLTVVSLLLGIGNKRYLYHVYTRQSDDDMQEFVDIESQTHEYLPVYRLGLSLKEMARFSTMRATLLDVAKATQADSCTFDSPLMVLLIGESYNRHHASLYGYDKPTTPHQEQLKTMGSLHAFSDVIASYNLTFKSFQNMLTFYDYDSSGKWYAYPMVTTLFRSAGYEVDFFSNQYTLDKSSAFSDYTEDVFMNNPAITRYQFDRRNDRSHPYDMDLLDDFHRHIDLDSDDRPRLVIFHFAGIHVDYARRYPEGYGRFSVTDYDRHALTSEQKQTMAHYDNAVLYNDAVVDSIVSTVKNRDAIVVYVPDHGELVFDDNMEYGRNFLLTREYIRPQYDIPFWIYCTDAYRKRRPETVRQIASSVDKPFMTDDLPHLLVGLAGIRCKDYRPERDLISPLFDTNRRRLIGGQTDYDAVCRQP
ncbi:MAG: phosphoethanolamine transferase [Prevotella sp.]|nr:phosphoethanolamine transferase [Prevotella sp.]